MKQTTYRIPFFSFYDHTAIREHLVAMAAAGWLVERPGNLLWRYRRIEPKKLHIAVTYFPKASEFDPGPTEGQRVLAEFAARDGWQPVVQWGQMQIFSNEGEDPTPIETDAVTQVETIHRTMRRSMLPAHLMLLLLCIYQLVFAFWRFHYDPIDFLSRPSSLYMVPAWLILILELLFELWFYHRWRRRARIAAETDGTLLPIRPHRKVNLAMFFVSLLMLLLAFGGSGSTGWFLVVWLAVMAVIFLLVNGAKRLMKRLRASRAVNRTVSFVLAFVLSAAFFAGLAMAILRFDLWDGRTPVDTYEYDGVTLDVYDDPLPLEIEGLMDVEGEWSKEARREETFLLARTEYHQWSTLDRSDAPELEYTVVEVKAPALYDFCKKSWLAQYQDEPFSDSDAVFTDSYHPVDAAPWGAEAVYQHHWSGSVLNEYLVCWEDCIVEIHFFWEPTPEQIAVAAEKLNGAEA